jgi:hypothetical protein
MAQVDKSLHRSHPSPFDLIFIFIYLLISLCVTPKPRKIAALARIDVKLSGEIGGDGTSRRAAAHRQSCSLRNWLQCAVLKRDGACDLPISSEE